MSEAAKAALRRAMRRLRLRLSTELPDAGSRAARLVPERLLAARNVAGYAVLGSEFDPGPTMRRFAEAGARLARPAVRAINGGVDFHAWREGDPLAPDALGIEAPIGGAKRVDPDLILAPTLAFDRLGRRLGQGGGYFDRAIAALRARKPVIVLGLAFAAQEVAAIPFEAHDEMLDAILTETAYIEIANPIRRTP